MANGEMRIRMKRISNKVRDLFDAIMRCFSHPYHGGGHVHGGCRDDRRVHVQQLRRTTGKFCQLMS